MKKSKVFFGLKLLALFFVFVAVYISPLFFNNTPESFIYIVYAILAAIVIYVGYFASSFAHSERISACIGAAITFVGSDFVGLIALVMNRVVGDQIPWRDPQFYISGAIVAFIGAVLGYTGSWVYFFLNQKKS